MSTEIGRIGRTIAVEIPAEVLEAAGLAVGDAVTWRLGGEGVLELRAANGSEVEEVVDDEAGRWGQILARLTAEREDEGEGEDQTDWRLRLGTEYKRPGAW